MGPKVTLSDATPKVLATDDDDVNFRPDDPDPRDENTRDAGRVIAYRDLRQPGERCSGGYVLNRFGGGHGPYSGCGGKGCGERSGLGGSDHSDQSGRRWGDGGGG